VTGLSKGTIGAFGREICEPDFFNHEPLELRSLNEIIAAASEFFPAHVVNKDEHDVRLAWVVGCCCNEGERQSTKKGQASGAGQDRLFWNEFCTRKTP
jgi:hypothetical protein